MENELLRLCLGSKSRINIIGFNSFGVHFENSNAYTILKFLGAGLCQVKQLDVQPGWNSW